jgi:hypothetical protein
MCGAELPSTAGSVEQCDADQAKTLIYFFLKLAKTCVTDQAKKQKVESTLMLEMSDQQLYKALSSQSTFLHGRLLMLRSFWWFSRRR